MRGMLRLQEIGKSFSGVQALKGVTLELVAGEIHALVGENGAGKSTLIKIAGGIFPPDGGTVVLDGKPVRFTDPRDAERRGIVVIHQTPTLCPHLSVTENILLGHLPTRWGIVQWKRAGELAADLLARLNVTLPLDSPVGMLSAAQQQLVALARALSLRARWLILDEPTAALSRSETERLFAILRQIKSQGVGVLFVSHRLDEVLELADRITVLRDGEKVVTLSAADTTREQLITFMAGRSITPPSAPVAMGTPSAPPLLRLRGVVVPDFIRGVSLEIRSGEVVGLFGLVGSGRSELAQAIVGLRPIASGVVEWRGKPVRFRNPQEALAHGVAYLPEDRLRQGLLLPRSIRENIGLPNLHRFSRFGVVDERAESQAASAQVQALRVKAVSIAQPVAQLSGGNQQKVSLAKWLLAEPQLLILDEPTHGIDVATKAEIHRLIAEWKAQGKAILLISSELEEVQMLSDHLFVLRQGQIVGEFDSTTPQERILAAAFGGPSLTHELPSPAGSSVTPYPLRPPASPPRVFRFLRSREASLLTFLVVFTAFVGWRNPAFLSAEHWLAMVQESAPTLLVAGVMAAIIVSGNLDLSVGSVLGACAMAAGHAAKAGWSLPLAIATALGLGAGIGLLNGILTACLGLSSVIVTLGMLGVVRGTMLVFTKGYWVIGLPGEFRQLSIGAIAGVPNPVWIASLLLVILGLVMAYTEWGRDLYAMGSNPTAAWMVGIPVRRRLVGVFVVGGMMTGVAALLYAARFPVVQSETGKGFELTVITAAVLGGVNIFGGTGSVAGAVLGAFVVSVLRSALTFLQLPGEWDTFALGGLILLSVAIEAWRHRGWKGTVGG